MKTDMKTFLTSRCFVVTIGLLFAGTAVAQTQSPSAGEQTPSSSPPSPAPSSNRPVDYVVGPQDVLRITVFDEPTMSGTYRVDTDGSFQYPMLGRVPAAGSRVRDIEQMIKTKLEDGFVRRAQVTVDVDQFRSRSIFIVGEVRSPGKYPMTGQMSLIEALAAAGSTLPSASSEVLILRPRDPNSVQPLTPDQVDQTNVHRISLADLQLGRLSENITMQEGDTIFVPKAEKFFVTGQIRSPGAYTYERGLTVLQAISLAGGLTDKGSNRRIKVIRTVKGKKTEQGIDLNDVIQPGDTLVIPQRLL
jgi:polysaccharide export outer membrane protein